MFEKSMKRPFLSILISVMVLTLVACGPQREEAVEIPVFSENYERFVRTLSSDEFEGRAPTTPGG